ncbi:18350_t:CDS:2 [Funneliformis geosporum]|uniref:8389_t:CDS:1 n=1 Tax=Funneliformis geosporum TaxID=1117311 RepID=A0A9W4WUR7_9GLOM|nr:8389_t:CDS:2 [Funneliformis geosporum]CAI2165970.1 18350_t:CDS:2 [Funneliformis geosporum]
MQLQTSNLAQNLQANNGLKEMVVKANETNNANNSTTSVQMTSNNTGNVAAANVDQETFIPQMPQQPQVKITKGGNSVPNFEYVSYDRVQDLYEQNKGTLYFIPEGFEPVLVPNDAKAQTVTNLLENAKPVSAAPNVPRMLPDTDVRLPSFALPCGVAGPPPKASSSNSKTKVKKPPRPPNAFILYRRAKQPGIVARHQGITNNEVSKEIGRMWHEEPAEIRQKFQKMADAAKQEHMKKYPEYRYRPRRPQERKRRIQPREDSPSESNASPILPTQSLPMLDTNAFYPRRISSMSADGENSQIYTPTTMLNQNYMDATMAKYDFTYLDDSVSQNSYDGSPISSSNTTFVNNHMTTNPGGIDFNVFDASQNGSNEAVNYIDFDAYDQYENMAALSFISADEHFLRNNPQFVKFDY